jgi:hypothetical protein
LEHGKTTFPAQPHNAFPYNPVSYNHYYCLTAAEVSFSFLLRLSLFDYTTDIDLLGKQPDGHHSQP